MLFDELHTQTTPPNFTSYTSKDGKGCRNDYIEAFCIVYWAKSCFKYKSKGSCNNPSSEDEG